MFSAHHRQHEIANILSPALWNAYSDHMALPQHDTVTTPPAERLRRSILALMGVHRMSQTALGQRIGLDQSGVSRRLKGELPFSEWELEKVAMTFDRDLVDLYSPETVLRASGYESDDPAFASGYIPNDPASASPRKRDKLGVINGQGRTPRNNPRPLVATVSTS